mmetsp:Transcript_25697/g.66451  ORF Transcript_25697/g.66451 Transcript_25697/m.66451 type:complete len:237 (+) Transcript_25697:26-736(+)
MSHKRKASADEPPPSGTLPVALGRSFTGMIRVLRGYRPVHGTASARGLDATTRGPAFQRIAWDSPVLVQSAAELEPILASLLTRTFSKNAREKPRPLRHALLEQSRANTLNYPLLILFDRRAHAEHTVSMGACGAAPGVLDVHVERQVAMRAGATPVDIGRYTAIELVLAIRSHEDDCVPATRPRRATSRSEPSELARPPVIASTSVRGEQSLLGLRVRVTGSLPGAPVEASRVTI